MHTNFTRQQQQSTIPAKRTSQQSPGSWPQSTNIVSMPCQSTVRQQEWTTFTTETSVQQQQQQQPVIPMVTMTYNATTPGEHTNNGTADGSLRGMSLADIALSTADGASSTNWIIGDNSKNLAAAMQFLGGMPANDSNPYYASNIPFTSAPQQWPSYDFSDLPTDPN
ncbi:predicted protein [Lichtheimia corymbifera JMRC:FSU:9682]|uniref:Uncharacterized protein n=1 Tax=Lichtheimia corymbifera JMRC:FSU:9682 TaxID=1263082 RepID=A0A068S4P3_9FUNG|nr:predicted protein [Lichtheimia corymbifera JMRC:FSU:9682]